MEKKNKGFTLAELLVVVAIIGALVAIALPIFLKQKAEANLKTDQTFVKSAKATAISEYLGGDEDDDNGAGVDYIYDAGLSIAWKIDNTLDLSKIKGYGRSTQDPYKTKTGVTDESTPVSEDGNPNYLQVHVTTNGKVTGACWVKPGEKTTCGEGGTVTPDPTPTPGTPDSGNKDVINIGGVDISVGTWPKKYEGNQSYEVIMKQGEVYSYLDNGILKYYVVLDGNPIKFTNQYNYSVPTGDSVKNRIIFLNTENPRIFRDSAENDFNTVLPGDFYIYDDGRIYIRIRTSVNPNGTAPGMSPEGEPDKWVQIKI